MLPGSTRSLVDAYFKNLINEGRLEVFFFPEFLRQGSAVKDLVDPSLSVIGRF
jgi:GDP-mannose 6-dehydrogenase